MRGVPLFGRSELVGAVETRLAAGGGVALHGPPGIGRSAVLDAVAAAAEARGERVLRLRPARTERTVAYAGIADLIAHLPAETTLPPAQRTALAALRQGLPPRAGSPALPGQRPDHVPGEPLVGGRERRLATAGTRSLPAGHRIYQQLDADRLSDRTNIRPVTSQEATESDPRYIIPVARVTFVSRVLPGGFGD